MKLHPSNVLEINLFPALFGPEEVINPDRGIVRKEALPRFLKIVLICFKSNKIRAVSGPSFLCTECVAQRQKTMGRGRLKHF